MAVDRSLIYFNLCWKHFGRCPKFYVKLYYKLDLQFIGSSSIVLFSALPLLHNQLLIFSYCLWLFLQSLSYFQKQSPFSCIFWVKSQLKKMISAKWFIFWILAFSIFPIFTTFEKSEKKSNKEWMIKDERREKQISSGQIMRRIKSATELWCNTHLVLVVVVVIIVNMVVVVVIITIIIIVVVIVIVYLFLVKNTRRNKWTTFHAAEW